LILVLLVFLALFVAGNFSISLTIVLVGRATTTARFRHGNLAITEQCDYFEKCGPMFFDPAVYLIFEFHPDLIITDPAAFTNALNFCGIFHA